MPPAASHKNIFRYLSKYAEPEAAAALSLDLPAASGVVVIPAFDESPASVTRAVHAINPDVMVVLVINSPPDRSEQNASLIRHFAEHAAKPALLPAGRLPKAANDLSVCNFERTWLVVDRSNVPIPPKQGVGLARKIGADIALALMANGQLPHTWIHSTDADVILPPAYADIAPPTDDVAAVVYPFAHHAETTYALATQLYEIALYHYVAGLALAGSPYAHHTIGSTIAVNPWHYASVRGFPRRSSREDFYILNKLRKLGIVRQLNNPQILVSGRPSTRVPVGTGTNILRISSTRDASRTVRYYAPETFIALKVLLAQMRTWQPVSPEGPGASSRTIAPGAEADHAAQVLARLRAATAPQIVSAVDGWWQANNIDQLLGSRHFATDVQRQKFLDDWFDGFRTMKFVHAMRDQHFGTVLLADLGSPFLPPGAQGSQLVPGDILDHLRHLVSARDTTLN